MAHNDRIYIRKLLVRCVIGIHDWERKTLQDVILDITLFTDLAQAGHSDLLADTVDYKSLTKQIIRFAEHSSFQLIESLAEGIADLCLTDPRVQKVRIRLEKPGALRFAQTVGVELNRIKQ